MILHRGLLSLSILSLIAFCAVAKASTLEDVKAKGYIQCGVSNGLPGFSNPDEDGHWSGLDVDMCRAVAAAVLGDAQKVKFTSLSQKNRLSALQSHDIDILSRTTTHTLMRDSLLDLNWATINYYDGQSFMVRKDLNITNAKELSGAVVCVTDGTTTALNLEDYFRYNKMELKPNFTQSLNDALRQYEKGTCDVITNDQSSLAGMRLKLKDPENHMILPDVISKEPLGPVVRQGDDEWLDIVHWTFNVMLEAEENGLSQKNIDSFSTSSMPVVRRILGLEGDMGRYLGLDNKWSYNIIKQVGNYAESFERNVGRGSPLNLSRGLNRLWKDGGLQYSSPIR